MEQLIKRLKELGYELVYDESSGSWEVVDFIDSMNHFLASAFSRAVFDHGFVFSVSVMLNGDRFRVKFYKRKYLLSLVLCTGQPFQLVTSSPVDVVCAIVACSGSVSNVSISPVSWLG